tara:strand:- start:303 stop:593 length:291 start_codon:yes stop_codon:yes gene_type:complete
MAFKMKGTPMYRNYGVGSPAKKGHGPTPGDPVKTGDHTTHGNPSKYTTASGKSVDSANIDEGNLSKVMDSPGGKKYVVVQDDTERFKAGTKLYINK